MNNTLIEINSNNLIFNHQYYYSKTNKKIICVIKDNAYGHGFKEIITILEKQDIFMYAVANISEAIEVSKYTKKDILILDKVNDFSLVTNQMILTIISKNHLQEIIDSRLKLRVHLKINTGMNRKGINSCELEECIKIINNNHLLSLEGIYTHYANNKRKYLLKQFNSFKSSLKNIDTSKYLIHASSSVSSLLLKEDFTNAIRIGIGLYGLNCSNKEMNDLKPVLSLYSFNASCTPVKRNQRIGYDYKYKSKKDGFLVLSPIGYGLGYLRRNHYHAFIKGEYLKQISNVCMDCCIFFSSHKIKNNERIELIGPHIKADMLAKKNKCSVYEMVTLLNNKIKRIVI